MFAECFGACLPTGARRIDYKVIYQSILNGVRQIHGRAISTLRRMSLPDQTPGGYLLDSLEWPVGRFRLNRPLKSGGRRVRSRKEATALSSS